TQAIGRGETVDTMSLYRSLEEIDAKSNSMQPPLIGCLLAFNVLSASVQERFRRERFANKSRRFEPKPSGRRPARTHD
ncbi:MAG: hypothetical protein WA434_15840, partial [Candidatus Acidiferrales bacterium]